MCVFRGKMVCNKNDGNGKPPKLDGLDVFSAGEATADERLEEEQKKLAKAYRKTKGKKEGLYSAIQDMKTTRTKLLDWPVPYHRPLGSYGDDDVVDYLKRLEGVHADVMTRESIERCLEKNVDNGKRLPYRKKGKDEKAQKRENFLHFTVLAYLGYFKSTLQVPYKINNFLSIKTKN